MVTCPSIYVLTVLFLAAAAHAAMNLPNNDHQANGCPGFCFRRKKIARQACRGLAACGVRRCSKTNRAGVIVRTGFSCQSRLVRPSARPSPTPEAGPGAPVFEAEVIIPAGKTESQPPTTVTDGAVPFSVAYDVKVASQGLLDISNVTSEVKLSCGVEAAASADGSARLSVRVEKVGALRVSNIASMYPIGSVFTIGYESFPDCVDAILASATDDNDDIRPAQDIYMYIDNVSGTPEDATIVGAATNMMAAFETADITISAEDTGSSTASRLVTTDAVSVVRQDELTPEVFEFDGINIPTGSFALTGKGKVTNYGRFSTCRTKWTVEDVNVRCSYVLDLEVDLQLKVEYRNEATDNARADVLEIAPYHACQNNGRRCNLFKGTNIKKTLEGAIPKFSLKLTLSGNIIASNMDDFGMITHEELNIKYRTARHNVTLSLRGDADGSGLEADTTLQNGNEWSVSEVTSTLFKTADMSAHFQVVPTLRFNFISALLASEFTHNALATVKTGSDNIAFNSLDVPGASAVCKTCHHVQVRSELGPIPGKAPQLKYQLLRPVGGVRVRGKDGTVFQFTEDFLPVDLAEDGSDSSLSCLHKEFDTSNLNCGNFCCDGSQFVCDREKQECVKKGHQGGSSIDDPHIRCLDNYWFDCQVQGEFTFMLSEGNNLEVQKRYLKLRGPTDSIAWTQGVALKYDDLPTVQVSEPLTATSPRVTIAGRDWSIFIGGVLINPFTDDTPDGISFSGTYPVSFNLRDDVRVRVFTYGIYVDVSNAIVDSGDLMGLAGKRQTRDGVPVVFARYSPEWRREYCKDNWRVEAKEDSLFVPDDSFPFDEIKDDTPVAPINTAAARADIKKLCGTNQNCLLDGMQGGRALALQTLNIQKEEAMDLSLISKLKFSPVDIEEGSTVGVKVQVDVSDSDAAALANLEKFAVYFINQDTNERVGTAVLELVDDGSAISRDDFGNDNIYSNVLPVFGEEAGDEFSFEAVPIISGREDATSELLTTALSAIQVFTKDAEIVETDRKTEDDSDVRLPSFENTELVINVTWSSSERILETTVRFVGEAVSSETNCEGPEQAGTSVKKGEAVPGSMFSAVVALGSSENATWSDSAIVSIDSDWMFDGAFDAAAVPVRLSAVLRDARTQIELPGRSLSTFVKPRVTFDCPSTLVATIKVQSNADERKLAVETFG